MQNNLLLDRTLDLLANRPRTMTYAILAIEVNSRLPPGQNITAAWLEQFATGRIKRPDVTKIQRIYETLAGFALLN